MLQADVTANGMQAPDIHCPLLRTTAILRRQQQRGLQVRGQRPLHEVRWNAEVELVWRRSQPFLGACERQRPHAKQLYRWALLFVLPPPPCKHKANQGLLIETHLAAKIAKQGWSGVATRAEGLKMV
jgi:hypothetical protein